MYPVLVAAGGTSTLLWDYRLPMARAISKLPAKRRRGSSPSSQNQSNDGIELNTMSASSSSNPYEAGRLSAIRNRLPHASSQLSTAKTPSATMSAEEAEPTRHVDLDLMVLKKKLALPLAIISIIVFIVLIVVRSEIYNPPRWLEFFVNMIIAGVIIFGGGPVVIPLLRQYTVAPGKFASHLLLNPFDISRSLGCILISYFSQAGSIQEISY